MMKMTGDNYLEKMRRGRIKKKRDKRRSKKRTSFVVKINFSINKMK